MICRNVLHRVVDYQQGFFQDHAPGSLARRAGLRRLQALRHEVGIETRLLFVSRVSVSVKLPQLRPVARILRRFHRCKEALGYSAEFAPT